jgi:hypothetical protein
MHEIETAVRENDTGTSCAQGLELLNQLFSGHNLLRHGRHHTCRAGRWEAVPCDPSILPGIP